ncbi:LegC family aminotransferase [Halothiobacillus neapolitanus]|jgi:aminotransferase in exopolysaccharide biosynthesis|uniref:DegT/DnrJ/EryC1/StrS aminotransferase n=1 Tax=Halothiobacillus neapolitanus (strain ATCC 23641 / DSM 15147 / CIP 104769 / NCIMB 8539 / c2) TaxID=555778 RepID=D0KYF9_HALNC|nr:LegC family aminotransferase [Halothiobacillus neapolitanus]ACX95482.1 DegT/DnrJ/EryC1/StrS aminotransferase [Halothiobacillus neapolitanus c2]OZB78634.1 MAG: aminotransferase DegT [Halothiobacillus sp. 13-55-115]TDN65779.1 aminotransferase in exopolysaccharide biosynthesis [Halothiobacillus neapolitanus]
MCDEFIQFVRALYEEPSAPIPLHVPVMGTPEKEAVAAAIDSTFVSSVGAFVTEFERDVAEFSGAKYAVATVNGTAALHIALLVAGVQPGDLVITQSLSFIATCNAIHYCGADPLFIDVDEHTLGLSPSALRSWLERHAECRMEGTFERATGRRIRACVPMHTLGHPTDIKAITTICDEWSLTLVEDAAESLGSYVGNAHTGTFGRMGVFSFNGNKVITTGGGGMIVTDDEQLAVRAKHLSTTAKKPHPWAFEHDEVGYNYRLPNLNAAFGVAQMSRLPGLLASKREVASRYAQWCEANGWTFVSEPQGARSNYWLNAVRMSDRETRDAFLAATNAAGVMTRPLWTPMHRLPIYASGLRDPLPVTEALAGTLVNIPSSALANGRS